MDRFNYREVSSDIDILTGFLVENLPEETLIDLHRKLNDTATKIVESNPHVASQMEAVYGHAALHIQDYIPAETAHERRAD